MKQTFLQSAEKRLLKDYEELQKLDLPTVVAQPLEDNLFVWHANVLAPHTSDYRGAIFHLKFTFPKDYPMKPPDVRMLSNRSMSHSHIYGTWICLDMLGTHRSEERYFGWSSSYTISSILLQLQSFFLEEEHLERFDTIKREIIESNEFKCGECPHDASTFKYSPWKSSWSDKVTFEHPGHCELKPGKRMKDHRRFKKLGKRASKKRGGSRGGNREDQRAIRMAGVIQMLERRDRCEKMRKVLRRRNHPMWNKLSHEEIEVILEKEIEEEVKKQEEKRLLRDKEIQLEKIQKLQEDQEMRRKMEALKGWDNDDIIWNITQFFRGELGTIFQEVNSRWAKVAYKQMIYSHVKDEVMCFYTKSKHDEDVLGIGYTPQYFPNSKTKIQYAKTPLDLISLTAFHKLKVRESVWKEKFSHWLPLMISKEHSKVAYPLLQNEIMKLYCTGNDVFDPVDVLDLVSKLMNSMIVSVMEGSSHASCTALEGYLHFYRILIETLLRYPYLKDVIDEKIKNFISDEKYRIKSQCPSIGDFLPLISVSSYSWEDVAKQVVEETRDRNALWILKKFPELESSDERGSKFIADCFEGCQVSLRLLAYHQVFLTEVSRSKELTLQEIADISDESYGRPLPADIERFQKEIFKIQNISTYKQALEFMGYPKESLTVERISSMILDSFKNSIKKKYHRPQHYIKIFNLKEGMTPFKLYESLYIASPPKTIHINSKTNTAIISYAKSAYRDTALKSIANGSYEFRAEESKYGAYPPKYTGTTNRIFVRGCTKREILEKFFSTFGEIVDCYCMEDKGISFVTFKENEQVNEALSADGSFLGIDTYIRLKEATPFVKKTPNNRLRKNNATKRNFTPSNKFSENSGWIVSGKRNNQRKGREAKRGGMSKKA